MAEIPVVVGPAPNGIPSIQGRTPTQIDITTSGTPNTATRLSTVRLMVRKAIITADSGNAANVSFGANTNANQDSIPPGASWGLEDEGGAAFSLYNYWIKSSSASQVLRILYWK